MTEKTCFFIGSHNTTDSIRPQLIEVIEKHITEYHCINFTVGRYGRFDGIVQSILKDMKTNYDYIHNYLLCPYALNQKWLEVPQGFDCITYPNGMEHVPLRLAIVQANRITVKNSNYLIAHAGVGNSGKIVEYAQSLEKKGLIKITLL